MIVFGVELPDYEDCKRCSKKDSCKFSGYAYEQPCSTCRSSEDYQKEMDQKTAERAKTARINDSLRGQLPVGVHTFNGKYLYTNHKGDVIKEEKIRPMKQGEKWKK